MHQVLSGLFRNDEEAMLLYLAVLACLASYLTGWLVAFAPTLQAPLDAMSPLAADSAIDAVAEELASLQPTKAPCTGQRRLDGHGAANGSLLFVLLLSPSPGVNTQNRPGTSEL